MHELHHYCLDEFVARELSVARERRCPLCGRDRTGLPRPVPCTHGRLRSCVAFSGGNFLPSHSGCRRRCAHNRWSLLQGCAECGTEGGLNRPLSPMPAEEGGYSTDEPEWSVIETDHSPLAREKALPPIAFIPDQLRHLRYLLPWHLSSLWNRLCWIVFTSNSATRYS